MLNVPSICAGKTTYIRDVSRILSMHENVCIIDTSNEIAGDGTVPHSCIDWARRAMVPSLDQQHAIMVECIQNHTPRSLVVDEIGRKKEVLAAQTARQRGVRLIASAHGDFRSLLRNPELKGLLGGTETVTMGDEYAKTEGGGSKIKTQRAGTPIFDVIVQLTPDQRDNVVIIDNVAAVVDAVLQGRKVTVQRRRRVPTTGQIALELLRLP